MPLIPALADPKDHTSSRDLRVVVIGVSPLGLRVSHAGEEFILVAVANPTEQAGAPAERFRTHGLSAREADVAQLVLDGHPTLNIAACLGVKESTVRTHMKGLFRKLSVHNRVELAMRLNEIWRG